jgi:hypothetical protein
VVVAPAGVALVQLLAQPPVQLLVEPPARPLQQLLLVPLVQFLTLLPVEADRVVDAA